MHQATKLYYQKRGNILVKNLQSRHFEAYYCDNKEDALKKALELIPEGASVGWGGALSAEQIGLMKALHAGKYCPFDRALAKTPEEREQIIRSGMFADVFITGANGLSLDGQMVNIDGAGNPVAPVIFGPKSIIVVAGMNKVEDNLDAAINRARTVAAPMNNQRFGNENPCSTTGTCGNCKNETCICNQIVITRHCRPVGRIKFILVGEELGFQTWSLVSLVKAASVSLL